MSTTLKNKPARNASRILLLGGALGCLLAIGGPAAQAQVVVSLTDGSRIIADGIERDPKSGDLTARSQRPGISITRRLRPDQVTSVLDARQSSPPSAGPSSLDTALRTGHGDAPYPLLLQHPLRPMSDAFAGHHAACGACGLPQAPGRVIGVRDAPLAAYPDELARAFPNGVPVSEADFALWLMRAKKTQDVLDAWYDVPPEDRDILPPTPGQLPEGEPSAAPPRPIDN